MVLSGDCPRFYQVLKGCPLKPLIFVFVVWGLQGALYVLVPTLTPPDLFLLATLTLAARVRPMWGLGLGYAIGLLQDAIGAGAFGFHAAGLAAAVIVGYSVRRFLSVETSFNQALVVLTAMLSKWFIFIVFNYWTRKGFITGDSILKIMIPEIITTLVVAPLVFWLANWAFGRVLNNEEQLL
jgi:rod shape-determining protein MreD